MEKITLTAPYRPDPRQATELQVQRVDLNWGARSVTIEVASGSISRTIVYEGDEAVSMMVGLNKANLATKSLHRRVLERLVADGKLSGTIEGSPD